MRPSDKLHAIISVLTPAEKKYFSSVFSWKHVIGRENKYLLVFEAINKQERYDEQAILDQFASIIEKKDFPAMKTYLYDLILKCMREYRTGKTVEIRLREMFDSVDFLIERGLYIQAESILKKAREEASHYEEHWALYKILRIEKMLAYRRSVENLPAHIEQLNQQLSGILNAVVNFHELQLVQDQLFALMRTHISYIDPSTRQMIEEMMHKPLLQSEDHALSFEARNTFLSIQSLLMRIQGNLHASCDYNRLTIELWQKHPQYIEKEPMAYLRHLTNYAALCIRLERFDEAQWAIAILEKIPTSNFDSEAEKFQNMFHFKVLYALNTGAFEQAVPLSSEFKKNFTIYKAQIDHSREVAFYHNFTMLFFLQKEWRQALQWLNKILNNEKKLQVRQDILVFARLLEPVIHYELGNTDFIENLYRNNSRYLSKISFISSFDKSFLQFLRKLPDMVGHTRIKACNAMLERVETLRKEPATASILGLHEISLWLKSICTGRTPADLFMEEFPGR